MDSFLKAWVRVRVDGVEPMLYCSNSNNNARMGKG